jgi:hypothetical protein
LLNYKTKYLTLAFNCSPATGVRIFPSGFGALGSGTGAVIIHEIYVENALILFGKLWDSYRKMQQILKRTL